MLGLNRTPVNAAATSLPARPDAILGHSYRDKITGFKGVAIGHCRYLTGCNQTLLVPPCKEDGTRIEGEWFDDQRLERLAGTQVTLDNGPTPGCDRAAPKR